MLRVLGKAIMDSLCNMKKQEIEADRRVFPKDGGG